MTDKEKAEEYASKWCSFGNGLYPKSTVRQAFLDGLEEGQKEGILGMLDKCEEFRHKANELEEENKQLNEQIEKMKKFCDCEYCINVTSGDEFTVENTNKTVCEYCMENNKKLWKFAE